MKNKLVFVAEIGMNYEANIDLAFELIRQAKLSGADVAKFQFGWRDGPEDINFLDYERASLLKDWCDQLEIEFMASIISETALELARRVNPNRYKIASRTVADNPELCKSILSENKETFVSLGMWESNEFPFGKPTELLHYIYCKSIYPTYAKDLRDFPKRFSPKEFQGYSDHSHGVSACLIALSRGATYIEKHFTLNKTSQTIRDHTLSATPEEFAILTRYGREIARISNALDQ